MKRSKSARGALVAWIAATGCASAPSYADEQSTGATSTASAEQLEAVTVTGEKRTSATVGVLGDRKLIDTPFAITVLPREVLDLQQAAFYGDYLKNEPAATLGNVPVGFATLRGFSVGFDGYLYDGLAGAPFLSDARNQIEGVDRIEVLKGPSAFLFGATNSSSVGGIFNYVPKRPGDSPVRGATLNYIGKSLYGATADVADRIGPDRQFGYRINAGYKNGETAVDDYDWRHGAATVALDWRVLPGLVVNANFEYARNDFPRLQPFYVLSPGLSVPRAPDAKKNLAQKWDDFGVTGRIGYLRADWSFADDWSLTAQGSRTFERRKRIDEARFGVIVDDAGNFLQLASRDDNFIYSTSGQALVNGAVRTGPLTHRLAFGATVIRQSNYGGSTGQGAFFSNLYARADVPQPEDVDVQVARTQRSRSTSFLASDVVEFTRQWSLLGGARRSTIRTDNFDSMDVAQPTNRTTKTSPTGALLFKPVPNSLVYANYSTGLEQGGTAPAGSANANQVLPAVVTRQVEAGAKLDLDRLSFAAAIFNLRRPREFVDPVTFLYRQSGIQRHRGVEATVYGRVTPDLLVVAGTMFLDTKVSGTGDPASDGRHPEGVAQRTANLFVDYRLGSFAPGWFVNAGVYAVGPQYLDAQNTQRVPGYARLDAGVRYETRVAGGKVSALLGVENVADRSYWAGAQSGILTLADPLVVKATLRADF